MPDILQSFTVVKVKNSCSSVLDANLTIVNVLTLSDQNDWSSKRQKVSPEK